MQTWHVAYDHGQEQYFVELEEVSWWALAASSVVYRVDAILGHHFCGNRFFHGVFNWLLFLGERRARSVHRFNVAAEVAQACGAGVVE